LGLKKGGLLMSVDLKDWDELMKRLDEAKIDDFIFDCAKDLGQRTLREVRRNTPVLSGVLMRNWKIAEKNKYRGKSVVKVENITSYASHVEYGHKQQSGRYVKAIGKRLVKSFVSGKYFMQKSVDSVNDHTDEILGEKVKKKLESVING